MKNPRRISFTALFFFVFVFHVFSPNGFSQPKKRPVRPEKKSDRPVLGCTAAAKKTGEQMTYLVGAGELTRADKNRIRRRYGSLTLPRGETEHAKEIRARALAAQQSELDTVAESLKIWERLNPNATAEQIKRRLEVQQNALGYLTANQTDQLRIASPKWDWREHNIDVGPVMNQGDNCHTCWAFASTDAAAASQRKHFEDELSGKTYRIMPDGNLVWLPGAYYYWTGDPGPFVQDLLNCMKIPEEEICEPGWHGEVFDFMVYGDGIPLALADGYWDVDKNTGQKVTYRREYKPGRKFACRPTYGLQKAYSWDYVNSPPDRLPTVEQLKNALIKHGPLVAPIIYDDCLWSYRGGVFNEKNKGEIGHVVLLIGWDDAKGAWLVKNSWGEEWGEKGFGWIKYGSNNIGVFAAWIDSGKKY